MNPNEQKTGAQRVTLFSVRVLVALIRILLVCLTSICLWNTRCCMPISSWYLFGPHWSFSQHHMSHRTPLGMNWTPVATVRKPTACVRVQRLHVKFSFATVEILVVSFCKAFFSTGLLLGSTEELNYRRWKAGDILVFFRYKSVLGFRYLQMLHFVYRHI